MRPAFLLIATTLAVVVFQMTIVTGHLQRWAWAIPLAWGLWALGWIAWLSLHRLARGAHRWRRNRRWRRQF
jgi:hypothetical protein